MKRRMPPFLPPFCISWLRWGLQGILIAVLFSSFSASFSRGVSGGLWILTDTPLGRRQLRFPGRWPKSPRFRPQSRLKRRRFRLPSRQRFRITHRSHRGLPRLTARVIRGTLLLMRVLLAQSRIALCHMVKSEILVPRERGGFVWRSVISHLRMRQVSPWKTKTA
jgi:hypothetical protein